MGSPITETTTMARITMGATLTIGHTTATAPTMAGAIGGATTGTEHHLLPLEGDTGVAAWDSSEVERAVSLWQLVLGSWAGL